MPTHREIKRHPLIQTGLYLESQLTQTYYATLFVAVVVICLFCAKPYICISGGKLAKTNIQMVTNIEKIPFTS